MRFSLAALLACLALGQDHRQPDLFEQLGSDDPATRTRAVETLLRRPDLLPQLREALPQQEDPEVRVRLRQIIEKLELEAQEAREADLDRQAFERRLRPISLRLVQPTFEDLGGALARALGLRFAHTPGCRIPAVDFHAESMDPLECLDAVADHYGLLWTLTGDDTLDLAPAPEPTNDAARHYVKGFRLDVSTELVRREETVDVVKLFAQVVTLHPCEYNFRTERVVDEDGVPLAIETCDTHTPHVAIARVPRGKRVYWEGSIDALVFRRVTLVLTPQNNRARCGKFFLECVEGGTITCKVDAPIPEPELRAVLSGAPVTADYGGEWKLFSTCSNLSTVGAWNCNKQSSVWCGGTLPDCSPNPKTATILAEQVDGHFGMICVTGKDWKRVEVTIRRPLSVTVRWRVGPLR